MYTYDTDVKVILGNSQGRGLPVPSTQIKQLALNALPFAWRAELLVRAESALLLAVGECWLIARAVCRSVQVLRLRGSSSPAHATAIPRRNLREGIRNGVTLGGSSQRAATALRGAGGALHASSAA